MKRTKIFWLALFLSLFLISGLHSVLASTIMGTVYDNRRNPLADVNVELLDDLSRFRGRISTDGNGRYEFSGLGDGRYTVKVLPFRYDLVSQEQLIEVSTVNSVPGQNTSTTLTQDFYLTPKKGSIAEVEAGVIFAQEIPKEAKNAYEKAIDDLAKKRTEAGLEELKKAIKIFPNYFLALQRLGSEYFVRGDFAAAAPLMVKAADINNKSPLSFYTLGYSLYKLGYNKAAIVALKQAAILSPASASIFFTLGSAERLEGSFTEAETHLKQSKKLSSRPLPDIHWQLALLYGENLKRYSEAADELEQFLKESPSARDTENIKKVIKNYRDKSKQKS